MKIGDLVTFGRHTGVIVEDHTMSCSIGADEPYLMGAMMVLVEDRIERIVYANLRPASASR